MQILVTMQTLGRKRPVLAAVPFPLEGRPDTLRGLLTASVRTCVAAYHARLEAADRPAPMPEEALAAMEAVGKLAFGLSHGERRADPEEACRTAVLAFEDGLFRVFHGQEELTELDAPLALNENDAVTFIRLTFLTGGIF